MLGTPLERVGYPGGYPNAEGYIIMHDATPGDLRTAAEAAILRLCSRWRVDDSAANPPEPYSFDDIMKPTFIVLKEFLKDGLERPFLVRGDERIPGN